jgi:hypothetical protein
VRVRGDPSAKAVGNLDWMPVAGSYPGPISQVRASLEREPCLG